MQSTEARQQILSRLTTIVAETLDLEEISLTDETQASDVEGWDSLSHIRVMFAVETQFGLRFDAAEMSQLRNVGQLVDRIIARTQK